MGREMRRAALVGLALSVVGLSFAEWATLPQSTGALVGERPVAAESGAYRVTGWRGSLGIVGLRVPNLLVPVAAVLLAAACTLRMPAGFRLHPATPLVLAAFGFLHLAHLALVAGRAAAPSPAVFLTLGAQTGLLLLVLTDPALRPPPGSLRLARPSGPRTRDGR